MLKKCTKESLLHCLTDLGCSQGEVEQFLAYKAGGDLPEQISFLQKQRSFLRQLLHDNQKQIDCLDYLVYQLEKQSKL